MRALGRKRTIAASLEHERQGRVDILDRLRHVSDPKRIRGEVPVGMVELFVPMTAIIIFAVIVGLITRLIATGMLHKTMREALRSDPAQVALLAERLEARQPWADAVLGWIFIAFAAGLALLALTDQDGDRVEMLRAAIIPLIVGITVLVFTRLRQPPTS